MKIKYGINGLGYNYPTISSLVKKKLISVTAFSKLSEPCTELASIDNACSALIVPFSAS